jgi:RNA recognition motif-containing protein
MEAYCVKCRTKREMKDAKAVTMKNGKPATQGVCPVCGTKMFRIGQSTEPVSQSTEPVSQSGPNMRIYVGNLSYDVTEDELRQEFAAFGEVTSVIVIRDKYTGRPKGFGFVEMASVSEGQAAIAGLNGKTLKDRALNVDAARPRSDTRGGRSYGGRRGGGFG